MHENMIGMKMKDRLGQGENHRGAGLVDTELNFVSGNLRSLTSSVIIYPQVNYLLSLDI